MKMLRTIALMALLCALPLSARADELDGDVLYRMVDVSGQAVMSLDGRIYEGDEYISADNQLYVVISVDDSAHQAVAMPMGAEPAYDADKARAVFASSAQIPRPFGRGRVKRTGSGASVRPMRTRHVAIAASGRTQMSRI